MKLILGQETGRDGDTGTDGERTVGTVSEKAPKREEAPGTRNQEPGIGKVEAKQEAEGAEAMIVRERARG